MVLEICPNLPPRCVCHLAEVHVELDSRQCSLHILDAIAATGPKAQGRGGHATVERHDRASLAVQHGGTTNLCVGQGGPLLPLPLQVIRHPAGIGAGVAQDHLDVIIFIVRIHYGVRPWRWQSGGRSLAIQLAVAIEGSLNPAPLPAATKCWQHLDLQLVTCKCAVKIHVLVTAVACHRLPCSPNGVSYSLPAGKPGSWADKLEPK
mmetsp:Transcript_132201/g.329681  ORF Transcript_132201/g.329681 Transcript_132201/m.329681 type:complete len:206 (+) Transcript_132201:209-826(+)